MKTTVENDGHLLQIVSREFIKKLKGKGVDDDIVFDIHVGFEEALRNAMIHGNKMNPDKKVTVEANITEDVAIMCVEDEGGGFDPETLPDPTLDENLLKESGRGVYLIKHLMDEVKYENHGRKVVMKKYLNIKHK